MSDAVQTLSGLPAGREHRPKLQGLLIVVAVIFAFATTLYSVAWMYYIRLQPQVEFGIDAKVWPDYTVQITSLYPNGPAEKAGLKVGDRILAINGESLKSNPRLLMAVRETGHPGDRISLIVERPGEQEHTQVQVAVRPNSDVVTTSGVRRIAMQIMGAYPLFFLIVGLAVLFMRIDDRNAWLLALLFAGFITISRAPEAFVILQGGLGTFLLGYRAVFLALIAPLFYFFFAVFPTRSPLDFRLPWLKWLLLVPGAWFGLFGLRVGNPNPDPALTHVLGDRMAVNLMLTFIYGTVFLGFISLAFNSSRAPSAEAKRKIRVILWGALIGITPATLQKLAIDFAGYQPPFWLDFFAVLLVSLFPVCFAYAVVKHRVLEIPVLLRLSARYLLVRRGFALLVLLMASAVDVIVVLAFSKLFQTDPRIAMSIGMGFGLVLAWVSAPGLRHATQSIDRAFFRGSYDARTILQDLAQKVRSINYREELASLLQQHLSLALHPSSLAIYLKSEHGSLQPEATDGAIAGELKELPGASTELADLARYGQPLEVNPDTNRSPLIAKLFPLHPECLVPVLGRSTELMGIFVLGPRLSEEPYSKEDQLLLGSVASQAGLALESIQLAQEMAERIESDRRAAQEMQIARQVQSKLLPQEMPPLKTLDYSGLCVQARAVGGDYYDFLDVAPGKVGLVLADIAGKGISGALLMANLQANLRSQYAIAGRQLAQLLLSVNRLFFKNTESSHYATMFFGLYEDETRRFRYANCGHNPALLLRADGSVERLHSTTTVLGLFEQWECVVAEVQFEQGDILAIYTDGITEAANAAEEEFGEERLLQFLQANRNLPASQIVERVMSGVQEFSPGEQGDDLTLIVCRVRAS
ncbi:MAG TPA: SpoIIE family protein phosphatase [Candidatus Angelobacter sp.]|jgi:sigma-B regulation protein RsbU (phosphoserine phosphatase)|nr:SpoIIE family protein phosphatase [Candidatus Angelobacter sp.]